MTNDEEPDNETPRWLMEEITQRASKFVSAFSTAQHLPEVEKIISDKGCEIMSHPWSGDGFPPKLWLGTDSKKNFWNEPISVKLLFTNMGRWEQTYVYAEFTLDAFLELEKLFKIAKWEDREAAKLYITESYDF